MELLLGCGNSRKKQVYFIDNKEWKDLVTLDTDSNVNPDYCFDLNSLSNGNHFPFVKDGFDELHAYEVLEHIGKQGDWEGFFKEFTEYHRILKPDGLFFITVPSYNGMWAWGDPGHTRVFPPGVWSFLNQEIYDKDVGRTSMTDYRHMWKGHFKVIHYESNNTNDVIVLRKENYNASREIQN